MLGRTANDLFWMSRYIERAENMARLLEVGYRIALLPREGGGEDGEAEAHADGAAVHDGDGEGRVAGGGAGGVGGAGQFAGQVMETTASAPPSASETVRQCMVLMP